MNAYELADELNKYKGIATKQASDMLRQQADRIAELEKDLHMLQRHYDQLDHDVPNAEPVAWMELYKGKPNNLAFNDFDIVVEPPDWTRVPLYTTPQTKPLSDEEIKEIIKQQDWFSMSWVDMVRRIEERILGK